MARLFVLSGPNVGKIHKLSGTGPWILGRVGKVDIQLRGKAVSREHARIEKLEGGWAITDLNSSNGTQIGGARQSEAWLEDGDELVLGDVELRFRTGDGAVAPPKPKSAQIVDAPAEIELELDLDPDGVLGAADDGQGLELEGDWDEGASPPIQQPIKAAAVSPVSQPKAPARKRTAAELARAEAAAHAAPQGKNRLAGGGHILQYQRKAQREGLFAADLSQLSLPVRYGLYVVGLLVMSGLAYGAFLVAKALR